jgi:hypothetical protein
MRLQSFTFPDVVGLIGVALVFITYGALTFERIVLKGWRYSAGKWGRSCAHPDFAILQL